MAFAGIAVDRALNEAVLLDDRRHFRSVDLAIVLRVTFLAPTLSLPARSLPALSAKVFEPRWSVGSGSSLWRRLRCGNHGFRRRIVPRFTKSHHWFYKSHVFSVVI